MRELIFDGHEYQYEIDGNIVEVYHSGEFYILLSYSSTFEEWTFWENVDGHRALNETGTISGEMTTEDVIKTAIVSIAECYM